MILWQVPDVKRNKPGERASTIIHSRFSVPLRFDTICVISGLFGACPERNLAPAGREQQRPKMQKWGGTKHFPLPSPSKLSWVYYVLTAQTRNHWTKHYAKKNWLSALGRAMGYAPPPRKKKPGAKRQKFFEGLRTVSQNHIFGGFLSNKLTKTDNKKHKFSGEKIWVRNEKKKWLRVTC